MRGALTNEIQLAAQTHLSRNITQPELRLMVYVQYVMVNEQRIDPRKCNAVDRKVLSRWRREGHVEGGTSGLSITHEFWEAICAIAWIGYVVGGAQTNTSTESER